MTTDDRSSFPACLRRPRAGGYLLIHLHPARLVGRLGRRASAAVIPVIITIEKRGVMAEKTGLFRRLEAFEKLIVAANAEAIVAVAYLTEKESSEEFGETVEALAGESEQLRQKVACLLDAAGNENLDM